MAYRSESPVLEVAFPVGRPTDATCSRFGVRPGPRGTRSRTRARRGYRGARRRVVPYLRLARADDRSRAARLRHVPATCVARREPVVRSLAAEPHGPTHVDPAHDHGAGVDRLHRLSLRSEP